MGKNNKARRKAKAKAKASRSGSGTAGGARQSDFYNTWAPRDEPVFNDSERAAALLEQTAFARLDNDVPSATKGLVALAGIRQSLVLRESETTFSRLVDEVWDTGWRPAELHRQGKRGCKRASGGRLIATAIAVDYARRKRNTLDERWIAQMDALDLPQVAGRSGWLRTWIEAEGLDVKAALEEILDALANLFSLPALDELLPPPGKPGAPSSSAHHAGPAGASSGSDPILERIRALLAKAESSNYEAEALTFTAKAQELMTRHAIDLAMVRQRVTEAGEEPIMVRLPVDAPYLDVKLLLLQVIAQTTRCRTAAFSSLGMSTVFGFESDVSAVELLFTSLLVQAQTALEAAAATAPAGTRTRSQSYRSAFLMSYTGRIGERLAEINDAVVADAESTHGTSLLPALASSQDEVDRAFEDRFGDSINTFEVRRGYDRAGHVGGMLAADRAQLNFGHIDHEPHADPSDVPGAPVALGK